MFVPIGLVGRTCLRGVRFVRSLRRALLSSTDTARRRSGRRGTGASPQLQRFYTRVAAALNRLAVIRQSSMQPASCSLPVLGRRLPCSRRKSACCRRAQEQFPALLPCARSIDSPVSSRERWAVLHVVVIRNMSLGVAANRSRLASCDGGTGYCTLVGMSLLHARRLISSRSAGSIRELRARRTGEAVEHRLVVIW